MERCFERRTHPSSATTFLAMPPFRTAEKCSRRIHTASTAPARIFVPIQNRRKRITTIEAAAAKYERKKPSLKALRERERPGIQCVTCGWLAGWLTGCLDASLTLCVLCVCATTNTNAFFFRNYIGVLNARLIGL